MDGRNGKERELHGSEWGTSDLEGWKGLKGMERMERVERMERDGKDGKDGRYRRAGRRDKGKRVNFFVWSGLGRGKMV
jgi:hypothetical protein